MLSYAAVLLAGSMVVAQAKDDSPADWQGHLDTLVGEWAVSGKADGEQLEGTFTFTWAPSRKHLIVSGKTWPKGESDKEANSFDGLIGWDAAKQKLREFIYLSDGSSSVTLFAIKGNKGMGQRSGVTPDGTTWRQKLQYKVTDDSIVWGPEASQHVAKDGEVLGEYSGWVARRKP